MAFLAFDEPVTLPLVGAARIASRTGFSTLEWRVIALAGSDRLTSIARPSRVRGLFAGIFGMSRSNSLADPRLEALRRTTVLAWAKGDRLPDEAVADFLAHGFDRAQLVLLLGEVARRRSAAVRPAARAGAGLAIGAWILLALLIGTARIVGLDPGDALIGGIAGVLALIALFALRMPRHPARLA